MAECFAKLGPLLGGEVQPDSEFGARLVDLLGSLARFDFCVIFAYRGEAPPIDLFDSFPPDAYHVHVTLYQPGPYLLDPFYRAALAARPGFRRMRELAPDRFYSSEYFRSYYVKTGLAEEVGYFICVGDEVTVVLSLMRRRYMGVFTAGEIANLRAAEPVIRGLVAGRWRHAASRFDAVAKNRPGPVAELASSPWRRLNLTSREAEIVDFVLQGHSSEAIAGRLGVSTGTVKVHRRNVYRKLGISSQTELLALYIGHVVKGTGASHFSFSPEGG